MNTQFKNLSRFTLIAVALLVLGILIVPASLAQDSSSMENTITVTGVGISYGQPDIATIEIGVEIPDEDLTSAYSQVNTNIESIINALLALGIQREDIRTSGINIYSENYGMMPDGNVQNRYRASNRVVVTVRDLSMIEQVIDTSVASGANSIFGLQFSISDTAALEAEARAKALDDARLRAGQIAGNIGATLGDVVTVSESQNVAFPGNFADKALGSGGGAVIEPGRYSVSLALNVTFAFSH